MSEFNNSFPEQLDFPRASSYTPAPGKEKERASINWSIWNNIAKCTVWTRVDDDKMVNGKKQGPISAGFGLEVFEGIIEESIKLWESNKVDTLIFDNYTLPKKDDGSPTFEKVITSHFVVGRNEEGLCYYGLKSTDENRPVIMFTFEGMEWHKPRRRSAPFTKEELSTGHAVAMFRYIKATIMANSKGVTAEEKKAAAERRKFAAGKRNGGGDNYRAKQAEPVDTIAGGFGDGFVL